MCRTGTRHCRSNWDHQRRALENAQRRVSRNRTKAEAARQDGNPTRAAACERLADAAAREAAALRATLPAPTPVPCPADPEPPPGPALPPQFWGWVQEYIEESDTIGACYEPAWAAGACVDASVEFADYLTSQGAPGVQVVDLISTGDDPTIPAGYAHTVVEMDGIVIDFTHRQFHPDADVPHLQPTADYYRGWRRTTPDRQAAPVEVYDSSGDPVEVTPGVLDDNADWVYRNGQCLALAVALSEHTGWPVHLRTFTDGDDADPAGTYLNLRHAYVQAPDGSLVDVRGEHDADIVEEEARDLDGDLCVPARIVPATQARALLAEFAGFLEHQDTATAATFVEPVLRSRLLAD